MGARPHKPPASRHHEDHRRARPSPRRSPLRITPAPRLEKNNCNIRRYKQDTNSHLPHLHPTIKIELGEAMTIVQTRQALSTFAAVVLTLASLAFIGCNDTGKAAATPANFTLGINN